MKKLLLIFLVFVLVSCVNTRPFQVGGDIDASWQLRYEKTLDEQFRDLTRRLCPLVSNSKIAVLDFVGLNSDTIDRNGKYVAYLLSNDLNDMCECTPYYVGTPSWFDYKDMKISGYPRGRYEFAIVGSYRYDNGCYDVFVRLIDLREGIVFKTYAFVVSNKKVRFSIEPLHIPNYVEFP